MPAPVPTKSDQAKGRVERMRRSASLTITKCNDIQALLMRDIENPTTMAHHRAAAARAWEVIEERKRILRGKPLPGQLRPDLEQRRRKVGSLSALKLSPPVPMSELPTVDDQKTSAG